MAVELASAYVSIIPTTKGIGANLERELSGPLNAAAKKAGDEAGKTMKMSLSQAGTEFTKFGIGALAVAGAVGVGLVHAGKSASSLGESINAVQVTFGKSAAGILKLGENAADTLNLSNTAFNSLAVQFSNFAKTIAGSGGDVVGVMKDLTGRAGDFASVMDIDVREATTLFQSGLAGETEPLRKYGIDLSAAAVKAFAAANGIGTLGKELTEGEKVQARYALIMEKTSAMQDDLANTAGSAANQMRHAGAVAEDASASLGEVMAPAMAFAAGKAAELAGGLVSLNDATGGWLAKGAGIAALALGVAGAFSVVIGQALKMHERFTAFSGALSSLRGRLVTTDGGLTKLGKAARGVGVAMGVAGAALVVYELIQAGSAAEAERFAKSLDEINRATDSKAMDDFAASVQKWTTASVVGQAISQTGIKLAERMAETNTAAAIKIRNLAASHVEFREQLEANGITVEQLTTAIDNEAAAQKRSKVATEEASAAVDEETTSVGDLNTEFDYGALAAGLMTGATEALAKAAEEATRKSEAHKTALENERESLRTLFGIERTAVESKYAFIESTKQANADIATLNETLKHHKAGSEEATAANDAAKDSILRNAENYATLKGAALDSRDGTLRQIDALKLQAAQLAPGSELRKFLDEYINDLHNIPANVATSLNLEVKHSGTVGKIQAVASGGYVRTPWQVVGEEGPELVDLPTGSYVHTAAATRDLMASGVAGSTGGAVTPITVNNYRRDIGVADMNQVLAMARLAS